MELEYRIEFTKKIAAQLWTGYYFYHFRKSLILTPVLLAFSIGAALYYRDILFYCILGAALTCFAILTGLYFFKLFKIFANTKKLNNKIFYYKLTDNTIFLKNEYNAGEMNWDRAYKMIESKSFYLLLLKGSGYIPISREFLTPEYKTWINRKITPA